MLAYVTRRLFTLLPVWIGVTALTFVLIHALPGGPFSDDIARPPEVRAVLERHYHLDRPLPEQYARFIAGVVRGDLGRSMVYRGLTVNQVVRERFPTSLQLGVAGLLVSLGVGIPAGVFAASRRNTLLDHVIMSAATIGYAVPSFVMSLFLIVIVGAQFGLLPLGGWGSPSHFVLPAIALGLPWAGLVARHTRSAMLGELSADYVRTARAKGAGPRRVLTRHVLRNALISIVTLFGLLTAEMITGSLVIENIFGIPGMGRYLVQSVLASDYSMVLGLVVFYAFVIFVANLAVDISYALLNPRIRY
jgi:oligopeptide transport system permease protein